MRRVNLPPKRSLIKQHIFNELARTQPSILNEPDTNREPLLSDNSVIDDAELGHHVESQGDDSQPDMSENISKESENIGDTYPTTDYSSNFITNNSANHSSGIEETKIVTKEPDTDRESLLSRKGHHVESQGDDSQPDTSENISKDSENIGDTYSTTDYSSNFITNNSSGIVETLSIAIGEDSENGNRNNIAVSRWKISWDWIFIVTNIVMELPSAVFDQLSSAQKPQYTLIAMTISFVALLICVIQLLYKCQKEQVKWRWRGRRIPWFYYPPPSDVRFGTFADIIGLSCAIPQVIITTINYSFARHHADGPIKISVWPIIFAFGLLCSKFLDDQNSDTPSTKLHA